MRQLYEKIGNFKLGVTNLKNRYTEEEIKEDLRILLGKYELGIKYSTVNKINRRLLSTKKYPKEFLLVDVDTAVEFLHNFKCDSEFLSANTLEVMIEYSDYINITQARDDLELLNGYTEAEERLTLTGDHLSNGNVTLIPTQLGLDLHWNNSEIGNSFFPTKLYYFNKEDQMLFYQLRVLDFLCTDKIELFKDYCKEDRNKIYSFCNNYVVEDYLFEDRSEICQSQLLYFGKDILVVLFNNEVHIRHGNSHNVFPYCYMFLPIEALIKTAKTMNAAIYNGELACTR